MLDFFDFAIFCKKYNIMLCDNIVKNSLSLFIDKHSSCVNLVSKLIDMLF